MKKMIYIVGTIFCSVLYGWIGSLFGQTGAYVGAFIGIIAGFYASSEMVKKHISRNHTSALKSSSSISIKKRLSTISISIICILSVSWIAVEYFKNRINTIEQTTKATIAANTLKHKKNIARLKTKHKKEITRTKMKHKKQIAKIKMKERSKRWFSSIPILGTVLLFWTGKDEYDDYESWKQENPNGSTESYAKYKAELLMP